MADVLAFETTNSFPVHPPDAIYTCWEDVCQSIQAFYQPTGPEDDIILLLEKTHQHLLDQDSNKSVATLPKGERVVHPSLWE